MVRGLYDNGLMLRRFEVPFENYLAFCKWIMDHRYKIVYQYKAGGIKNGYSIHKNEL